MAFKDDVIETQPILNEQNQQLAYSPEELSKLMSISIPSLARDRKNGNLGGIPFVKLGDRVLYPKAQLLTWISQRVKQGHFHHNDDSEKNSAQQIITDIPKRGRGRPKGTTKANIKKRTRLYNG